MLKFQELILRKFATIFLALFIIMGGIVYYWTKEFYVLKVKDSLLQNIELISFELNKDTDLDLLAKHIKEKLDLRLTVVGVDGEVIAESHKDKTKMDNHKYRAEIMQALEQDYGYKIRYSKTIERDLLYVAKKYTLEEKTLYIRLAVELKGINEQIISLGMKMLAVMVIFFLVVLSVTYKINTQIQYETDKIVKFLKALTRKNKSTYISSDFSKEFYLITNLLTKVSSILIKKEKQKYKYTQRLKASNRQKDDIISAISHEFKNPIAVINGYSQTLIEDENLNPNIRKNFIHKIYSNGNKLNKLIDTLRLSIKLDSGQQSASFKELNLYILIADTVENLKMSYPNKEIVIDGDKEINITADEALFSIVIANLVENAFKYSEDEVVVEFDNKHFRVIDTGIGISEKNLKNITDKFYRVQDNSWNNSLGLGLFIVNNIINIHNYSLDIKSAENKGSTFSVNFESISVLY